MKKFILLFIGCTILSGLLFNACDDSEDSIKDELRVGGEHAGGTIIALDDSKEHGVVAARKENIAESITWEEAKEKAGKLSRDGYSDWRLPTKDELNTMQRIRQMVVGSTVDVYGYCWSSHIIGDSVYVKNFSPNAGITDTMYVHKDSLFHLRVVRDF